MATMHDEEELEDIRATSAAALKQVLQRGMEEDACLNCYLLRVMALILCLIEEEGGVPLALILQRLLAEYLDRYTPAQARRHEVCPGITGLAQVSGRNALSWEQKFDLDLWYVDHRSGWLDMKILAMTVWRVVVQSGINQATEVTMEEFRGQLGDKDHGATT